MEEMEESLYYAQSDCGDGDSDDSLDSYDQEQLEIAMYCKIHFEDNEENVEHSSLLEESVNNDFDILVDGNNNTGFVASETNADYVLNQELEKKYDNVVTKEVIKSTPTKRNLNKNSDKSKAEQDNEDVKKSKQIHSLLRDSKFIPTRNDQRNTRIVLNSSSSDSDTDDQDVVLGESSDSSADIQIHAHTTTPRYAYSKMSVDEGIGSPEESDDTDTEHWAINEEDVFKDKGVTIRGRYYKPVRCHNCNHVGHLSKNCPKPKKAIVCALCSDEGHVCRNCPQSFCHNCEEPGHESKFCPGPRRSWNKSCHRCYTPGHNEKKCHEIWRQFHVTVTPGKIRKFTCPKKRKRISCFNCGDDGHYGHECEEDRMNRFLQVVSPFITRYKPVHEYRDIMYLESNTQNTNKNDEGWKSFDDIDAHVKMLRDNKKRKLDNDSGQGSCNNAESNKPDKRTKMTRSDNSDETKKPSPYIHMLNKSGKHQTGRNNFDKMEFTIQNESSQKSKKEKKRKTEEVESSKKGRKEKKEPKASKKDKKGKKDKNKSKNDESKETIRDDVTEAKSLSFIDLTGESDKDQEKKRKIDETDEQNLGTYMSSDKVDESSPMSLEVNIEVSETRKSNKKKKAKSENLPNDGNEPKKSKRKYRSRKRKSNPEASYTETLDAKGKVSGSKGRTVSYNQDRLDMSITTAGATSDKNSSATLVYDKSSSHSREKRNTGQKFTADDLFSIWSMESDEPRNKNRKFDQSEPRARISKKHTSHRNDNNTADSLFSIQALSKMQDVNDIDQPVDDIDDVEHQVHSNEWWNKNKKKRQCRKKNKKLNV